MASTRLKKGKRTREVILRRKEKDLAISGKKKKEKGFLRGREVFFKNI